MRGRVLHDRGDVGEEARALLAVDVPVVEAQRELGDLPDRDLVPLLGGDDPRLLAHRAEAEDGRLAGVDDRRAAADTLAWLRSEPDPTTTGPTRQEERAVLDAC